MSPEVLNHVSSTKSSFDGGGSADHRGASGGLERAVTQSVVSGVGITIKACAADANLRAVAGGRTDPRTPRGKLVWSSRNFLYVITYLTTLTRSHLFARRCHLALGFGFRVGLGVRGSATA